MVYLTDRLAYWLTARSSHYWEASSSSANQEIHRILWNPKVQCFFHNSPPVVSTLSHISRLHVLLSRFFKMHFNIILSSFMRLPSGLYFLQVSPPRQSISQRWCTGCGVGAHVSGRNSWWSCRVVSCRVVYSHCEASGHAFLSDFIPDDREYECAVRWLERSYRLL